MASRVSRTRQHPSRPTFGPRMDDVFFGEAPGTVWSIVHLPRVVHLNIEMADDTAHALCVLPQKETAERESSTKAGGDRTRWKRGSDGRGEDTLVFTFPRIATLPPPLHPDGVWAEFRAALAEEDSREQRLTFRAEAYRREVRAGLIAHLGEQRAPSAEKVHLRIQRSRWSPEARNERVRPLIPYRRSRPSSRVGNVSFVLRDVAARRESEGHSPYQTEERFLQERKERDTSPRLRGGPPISWRMDPRTRLWEAVRVTTGALVVGLLVGTLGSVSAVPSLTHVVGTTAGQGVWHLTEGLKAMTIADVAAGREELTQASVLFTRAENELLSSTNLAVRLLGTLDPKERYVSGRKLLSAGQKLSTLGGDAAQLVLLFQGEGTSPDTLTGTLERGFPLVQELARGLAEVDTTVRDVPGGAVPEAMRPELQRLQSGVHALSTLVSGFVGSHDVILELLGARRDRQYLVIFQNNRELRPTGGFIGSFALVDVSRGQVRKVHVDTVYNPDGQLRDYLIPPAPLRKLTDRWFTRDANWFADFRRSARKITSLFERSGGPTVDGVIAVTPTVLERLLRVTGPIAMPAYDVTVTAENVVDETQRLVTFDYDREKNTPKAFIADLLPEILNRVANVPKDRWGDLVGVLTDSLREKHVLIALWDPEAQAKVTDLGWAGAVEATEGDYLLRVEANIGGQKTDELIDQSMDYDVTIDADGSAVATVVTTRHHQGSRDGRPGWDPNEDWYRMPNTVYERILVPRGSELLEARGFAREEDVPTPFANTADYRTYVQDPDLAALEEGAENHPSGTVVSEEEGKTSFGNWIVTPPGETTVTVYRYRLPLVYDVRTLLTASFRYSLLLQSQPGHRPVRVQATVRLPPGFRIAWAGPEGRVTLEGERKATFTSVIASDSVWGIVAERL